MYGYKSTATLTRLISYIYDVWTALRRMLMHCLKLWLSCYHCVSQKRVTWKHQQDQPPWEVIFPKKNMSSLSPLINPGLALPEMYTCPTKPGGPRMGEGQNSLWTWKLWILSPVYFCSILVKLVNNQRVRIELLQPQMETAHQTHAMPSSSSPPLQPGKAASSRISPVSSSFINRRV